jgi:FixJ family two-component response regulator
LVEQEEFCTRSTKSFSLIKKETIIPSLLLHASKENSKLKLKSEKFNKRRHIAYVVDDDVSVCRALEILLKLHGFRVETFTRATDFLSFKHPKAPSCLVLDVRMPGMSGLALQQAMADRELHIPIIFITSFGTISVSVKAMKAGAIDFLPKPFTEKILLSAIEIGIAKNKIQNKKQAEINKINRDITSLSPRELEVFHFVVKGMLNKQIASKRGTSIQTIKVHRGHVMFKMHAKTLTELIHFAHVVGITSIQN